MGPEGAGVIGIRRGFPPVTCTPKLAALADAWSVSATEMDEPDWIRLRAYIDYLSRHPEAGAQSIAMGPPASGSPLMDNLLAGIAEKVADDYALPRPRWTTEVAPLDHPWEGPGTPRIRAANAAATPPQLVARGIFFPAASLWRQAK